MSEIGQSAGIVPVILSGGSGTRLWPRSRAARPKPFLPLVGEKTLFEQALERCADPDIFTAPLVVTGVAHLAQVERQAVDAVRIAVEPEGRNTAPAIGLAAALLDADAVMLVCPSDHHIADGEAFRAAALAAARLAAEDRMVAFGIAATRPETGYGYISRGDAIEGGFAIARFVEKPDRARAERFLAEGGHDWNGGIFAFRAGAFLAELATHRPEMAEHLQASVADGEWRGSRFHPDAGEWVAIDGESVDYAVMENTQNAAMVPADFGWSDIGSWTALREAREADADGNVEHGPAELVDCRNVMVDSDGPRVSAIGLDDVIIVVDGDEVLVTSADGAQKVGKLSGAREQ